LYFDEKKYSAAEEAFNNFIKIIRPKDEAYYGLGVVYQAENRTDDARNMFQKATELSPSKKLFRDALQNLSRTTTVQ